MERGLFRAKRINHCNDFVARVALEVVDSAWWKQQLRVKTAGSGTASLLSNKEGIAVVITTVTRFWSQPRFSRGSKVKIDPRWLTRLILGRNMSESNEQIIWDRPRQRIPELAVVEAHLGYR
jgi:hypothetical protein